MPIASGAEAESACDDCRAAACLSRSTLLLLRNCCRLGVVIHRRGRARVLLLPQQLSTAAVRQSGRAEERPKNCWAAGTRLEPRAEQRPLEQTLCLQRRLWERVAEEAEQSL